MHFPHHLARYGCLPTCWVHERKHRVVKRYGEDVRNTKAYERSVLSECICHNLVEQAKSSAFYQECFLERPSQGSAKLAAFLSAQLQMNLRPAEVRSAHRARLMPSGTCSRRDVVALRAVDGRNFCVGEVWLHVAVGGVAMALVSVWNVVSHDRVRGVAKWKVASSPQLVDTSDIIAALIFTRLRNDIVRTLVPWQLRGLDAVNQ